MVAMQEARSSKIVTFIHLFTALRESLTDHAWQHTMNDCGQGRGSMGGNIKINLICMMPTVIKYKIPRSIYPSSVGSTAYCFITTSHWHNTICCNMLKYYLVVMGYLQLFLAQRYTMYNRKQVQICTICTRNSHKSPQVWSVAK